MRHSLFINDIVLNTSLSTLGIVCRTWYDADDYPTSYSDPMLRPLKPGEYGVVFIGGVPDRQIFKESELRLIDRSVQLGDYVKLRPDDVNSAVVTRINVEAKVAHTISGQRLDNDPWITFDQIEKRTHAEIGDYVVVDDWIGQIIETFDECAVELGGGKLARLAEFSTRLAVGDKGTDILPPVSHDTLNHTSTATSDPQRIDTVLNVRHEVYCVAWLAINQSLHEDLLESKSRPNRFWYGEDISRLTLIRKFDELMRVGDRVHLKDSIPAPFTRHGSDSNLINVNTFSVKETRTDLEILWQDGTRQTLAATEIIPHLNPDEHDCWPGDHVYWTYEDDRKAAIVQSVNAQARTAYVLFPETGVTELSSLLELDPSGNSDVDNAMYDSSGLSVYRGDVVFIHREGSTNGYAKPKVPRIGELELWVKEAGRTDSQPPTWRREMAELGVKAAQKPTRSAEKYSLKIPQTGDESLHWIGEVTGLRLDGYVEVTHPDASTRTYPVERLTKLYDGLEQIDDMYDDISDSRSSVHSDEVMAMDDSGVWKPENDIDDWEDYNDEEDEGIDTNVNSTQDSVDLADVETSLDNVSEQKGTSVVGEFLPHKQIQDLAASSLSDDESFSWEKFSILSSAPPDHAFYESSQTSPTKHFMTRLAKEHRALASGLPDANVLIQTYEDRVDLLRSLIIGPPNTPYEDAPFVIDWLLGSDFPNSPPKAHFISWTSGNGRVNPNLYEDGKVCLSILGTWSGDHYETWSPTRSSLLQAVVSIQGLVLVREPWFCEPAYEKLRGTDEGVVNSRLYNERAYVLSRGFVRRAIDSPPEGTDKIIRWLYFDRHRLKKIIYDSQSLIERSRGQSKPEVNTTSSTQTCAVPYLTEGGILTLQRTLSQLQDILTRNTS